MGIGCKQYPLSRCRGGGLIRGLGGLQNWDECHDKNELAIPNPDKDAWKKAYLDGDFIKTVEYPDLNKKVEEQPEIELTGNLFEEDLS